MSAPLPRRRPNTRTPAPTGQPANLDALGQFYGFCCDRWLEPTEIYNHHRHGCTRHKENR